MANNLKLLSILLVFSIVVKSINCRPTEKDAENSVPMQLAFRKSRKFTELAAASPKTNDLTLIATDLVINLPGFTNLERAKRAFNSLEDSVKRIIAEQLGVEINEIHLNSSLTDDLGADSLDSVELIMAIEEEFGIEIPDEDAEKMKTVGDLVKYVRAHA